VHQEDKEGKPTAATNSADEETEVQTVTAIWEGTQWHADKDEVFQGSEGTNDTACSDSVFALGGEDKYDWPSTDDEFE